MKPLLFLLPFLLTACTSVPEITSGQTYQGYPCRQTCAQFRQGYDSAQRLGLNHTNQCPSDINPETIGCRAFINDFSFAQNADLTIVE